MDNKIYKKLDGSNNMSKETGRQLNPVGTRSGIMHGSCKKHKICADDCLPFRQMLNT